MLIAVVEEQEQIGQMEGSHDAQTTRSNGMQLIARAAAVMRTLAERRSGLGLSELAAAVDLPKSTTHRIVQALHAEDLVVVSGGRPIRLGPGAARLAAATRGTIRDELRPFLEQLSRATNETVDLAVLEGDTLRFIDQIPAPHRLRAVSIVGATFPLHCTANGKALLASLPRKSAAALLPARLPTYTANTITSRTVLWRELDRIATTGVAYDREEHHEGISAVGAVVVDALGSRLAITCPLPTQRFNGREAELARAVSQTAEEATHALGGLSA